MTAPDTVKIRPFRYVPLIVLLLSIAGLFLIPMKVVSYGYLPQDDALRHAAKAVSGKDWSEILVLAPGSSYDIHSGWHAFLGALHRANGWNAHRLVVFSVLELSALFLILALFFLKRPEAWLASLLAVVIVNGDFIPRLFLGRPYILTMGCLLVMCLIWPWLKNERRRCAATAIIFFAVCVSTWVHDAWYLFAVPLMSLFIAREWRAGLLAAIGVISGILAGAALTGNPALAISQPLFHAARAFGEGVPSRMFVTEFRPSGGNPMLVLLLLGMLVWRPVRRSSRVSPSRDPVFILAALCWVLGFTVSRFWTDWGMPAVLAWIALEFQEELVNRMAFCSWRRVAAAAAILFALYFSVTSDVGGRWTNNLSVEYLSKDNPRQAEWLPGPGGIIYSNEMKVFYRTFYENPHADWRYILGFEATMMPVGDLAILRGIQQSFGMYGSFEPWIRKMRREDRLVMKGNARECPQMPPLEWYYAAEGIWIGRLPRR